MKLTNVGNVFRLEGKVECCSCKGTGLYAGLAEKDGARVVCHYCKGTGREKISLKWIKFTSRKLDKKATRVYHNGMGYAITDKDVTAQDGRFMPFSQYGCSYKDWLKGEKPKPLKFLGCPYQHTSQGLHTNDVNGLYKSRCEDSLGYGVITNCKLYHDKENCWDIYEKEYCKCKKWDKYHTGLHCKDCKKEIRGGGGR